MEQEKVDNIACIGESFTDTSMLEQVIQGHGLIAVNTEKLLDARPLSLVIASRLSTGQPIGEFSMPLMNGILHMEGHLGQTEVRNLLGSSALNYDHTRIHPLAFVSDVAGGQTEAQVEQENEKETLDEADVFLNDSSFDVVAKLEEKKCGTVIIHDFATVSNYFLDNSEKDSIRAIKNLQANSAAVIVFIENGTKGSALLRSMADVVFEVTRANNSFDAPISVACIKYPPYQINPPKPFCLSLSVINGMWDVTEISAPDDTLDLIISLACRGKKQEDIGAFIGLQQYQVSRLLQKAEKIGLITRHGRTVRRIK